MRKLGNKTRLGFLLHKCPADPRGTPSLPGEVKGLPVLTSPLLQPHSNLPTPRSRPCTRSKVTEPLKQAKSIGSYNGDTEGPSCVPHRLAKLAWPDDVYDVDVNQQ